MLDPDSDSTFLQQGREPRNYVKFYRQWVRNNFKPGANMPGTGYAMESRVIAGTPFAWPATNLDESQVRAVSAYLLSLQ